MPDASRIVAQISSFLSARESRSLAELQALAETYAGLCDSANQRLRQCADFLRRGLRTEAIHHAEIKPDVLDLTTTLSMPQLAAWATFCNERQLTPPPALMSEVATEINKAYEIHQRLAPLIDRFRVLALARAPLADRLAVMREIIYFDSTLALAQDLPAYETARVEEIQLEAKRAVQNADVPTLRRLVEELRAKGWVSQARGTVLDEVRELQEQARGRAAIQQLRALVPALHEAHGALSARECHELLDRWRQIAAEGGIQVPPDLAATVAPIQEWLNRNRQELDQERKFREAVAALVHGLDAGLATTELENLHHLARSFDRALPPEVEERCERELSKRTTAHQRRSRTWIMGAAVAALVIAIVVIWQVQSSQKAARVRWWETRIGDAIEAGRLSEAQDLWAALERDEPRMASVPELLQQKSRLAEAHDALAVRRTQFRVVMDKAIAVGTASPDEAALAEADKLAIDPEHKTELTKFRAAVAEVARKRQVERDATFSDAYAKLSARVSEMDLTLLDRDAPTARAMLNRFQEELKNLQATPGVSPELVVGSNPLRARIAALGESMQRSQSERAAMQAEREAVESLAVAAASPAKLTAALEKFRKDFPASSRTAGFSSAIKQSAGWSALPAWEELYNGWKLDPLPARLADPGERLPVMEAYLRDHSASPVSGAVSNYAAYLRRARAAIAEDGPWRGGLTAMIDAPIMSLGCVRMNDGRVYYTPKNAKVETMGGGKFHILVVRDPEDKGKETEFDDRKVQKIEASAQAELAGKLLARLSEFRVSEWDVFGYDVAQMIASAESVDPILRATLVRDLLRQIKQIGAADGKGLDSAIESLNLLLPGQVAWMDPDDKAAAGRRSRLAEALRQSNAIADLRAAELAQRKTMVEALATNIRATGVVLREGENWRFRTVQPLPNDGILRIVTEQGSAGGLTLRQIGAVRQGEATIDGKLMSGVPEGTMVFVSGVGK